MKEFLEVAKFDLSPIKILDSIEPDSLTWLRLMKQKHDELQNIFGRKWDTELTALQLLWSGKALKLAHNKNKQLTVPAIWDFIEAFKPVFIALG